MKWMIARVPHICGHCDEQVKAGDQYLVSPYRCFCRTCGTSYNKGELSWDSRSKTYIHIDTKSKCDFCDSVPIGNIKGKAVCEDHIGNAI